MNCLAKVCIQQYQFQRSIINEQNVSEINPLLALDHDPGAQHTST